MGTNFYLHRKMNYTSLTPEQPSTLGCMGFISKTNDVILSKEKKEYVYRNKAYKTLNGVDNNFYQLVHIGKNSYGWAFKLCIYPKHNINNLTDWERELTTVGTYITDEYSQRVDPYQLLEIIKNKKDNNPDSPNLFHCEEDVNCKAGENGMTFDYINSEEKGVIFA